MDTALSAGRLSGTGSSSTARSDSAAPEDEVPSGGGEDVATLRYWAAAREAAGTAEETTRATTLGQALADAVAARGAAGERLALVLRRSSFLIDGMPVGKRDPETVEIRAGAVVEVLPPFAGG